MMKLSVFYATNRNPKKAPTYFGKTFNPVHPDELRFGEISLEADEQTLRKKGAKLAAMLSKKIKNGEGKNDFYSEKLDIESPELGSKKLFENVKTFMDKGEDVLVYIHGFNVSFSEAVGYAMALKYRLMLEEREVQLVLFTWPSQGRKVPFASYRTDRGYAIASGIAFSRGFQKLYAFLKELSEDEQCKQKIHLLCHSMGNFVLQNTLPYLQENSAGALPKIFSEIILASADVDDDAFEHAHKLKRLSDIARRVNIYYNRGDRALDVSDITKGNPNRLGESGPRHPLDIPCGVVNIDCAEIVRGLVEHSYYLNEALPDIARVLSGTPEDKIKKRKYVSSSNAYRLLK